MIDAPIALWVLEHFNLGREVDDVLWAISRSLRHHLGVQTLVRDVVYRNTCPSRVFVDFYNFAHCLMVVVQSCGQPVGRLVMHNVKVEDVKTLLVRKDLRLALLPLRSVYSLDMFLFLFNPSALV